MLGEMSEQELWEAKVEVTQEMLNGFRNLFEELAKEKNFDAKSNMRQQLQVQVTLLAVTWLEDELQAAQNMAEHYRQGGE